MGASNAATTIFTCPKPFIGRTAFHQRNALQSWLRLEPRPEIILLGDEIGVAETAAELGLVHIPAVACNDHGTPLVNDIFQQAERAARGDTLAWVNTDIILFQDFATAIGRARAAKPRFLMIGQRWDLDVAAPIDFADTHWEQQLRARVTSDAVLHWIFGVDYYVYTRGLFAPMPPFAVGRTAYDRWMIWRARARRVPVIDATSVVSCIHQNHERTYAALGKQAVSGENDLRHGSEAEHNQVLAREESGQLYDLRYATHRLTRRALLPFTAYNALRRFVYRVVLRNARAMLRGSVRAGRPTSLAGNS